MDIARASSALIMPIVQPNSFLLTKRGEFGALSEMRETAKTVRNRLLPIEKKISNITGQTKELSDFIDSEGSVKLNIRSSEFDNIFPFVKKSNAKRDKVIDTLQKLSLKLQYIGSSQEGGFFIKTISSAVNSVDNGFWSKRKKEIEQLLSTLEQLVK